MPHIREEEGPFGEYTAYYGSKRMNPEIEVTGITMRKDTYFQMFYQEVQSTPCGEEPQG